MAVVTVTYNSSAIIRELLESVRRAEPQSLRVVVIDNNSEDSATTADIVAEFGSEFIGLAENRGYGGAANIAVSELDDDVKLVLIVNPDVTVHQHAISQLVATLVEEPLAAVAGPKILNADGSLYPSARNQPSLETGLGHALFSRMWPSNPWSRAYRQELPTAESGRRTVGWLSGACLLVDRQAFREVGGFDERFFMYFEDVELGRRFVTAGRTNVYEPGAVVTHLGAHSTSGSSSRMVIAHHESAYLFLASRYPGTVAAPLRWTLRVALRLRARVVARRSAR